MLRAGLRAYISLSVLVPLLPALVITESASAWALQVWRASWVDIL